MTTLAQTADPVAIFKTILETGELPPDDQLEPLFNAFDRVREQLPDDPQPPTLRTEDRLLRMKEVEKLVNYSRRSIGEMVKAGTFPPPIRMNSRCHRWRLSTIEQYISSLESE